MKRIIDIKRCFKEQYLEASFYTLLFQVSYKTLRARFSVCIHYTNDIKFSV